MVHPQTSCYVSRLLQHNENMARVPFFIHKLDILFNMSVQNYLFTIPIVMTLKYSI